MKVSVSKVDLFQNTAQYKQSSLTQESYLQIEGRIRNKSSRIITERKNGFIRKYLLKANGTKVLISEVCGNEQSVSFDEPLQLPSSTINNSKEMLDLLNASSQFRSIRLK